MPWCLVVTLFEFAEGVLAPNQLFDGTRIHLQALEGDGLALLLVESYKGKTTAGIIWAAYHQTKHPEQDLMGWIQRNVSDFTKLAIQRGLVWPARFR